MAKIVEILKTENERKSTGDFNTVHLYKTGQFYTAYDWSAWIISAISYTDAVRNQTRDRRPLAVTRIAMAEGDGTFCKVGFPFKSIEKFCPLRQNFDGVENDHVTFSIPFPEPADGSQITYERIREAVDKWTESHEIKPPKRTQQQMKQIKAQRKAEDADAPTTAAPTNQGGGGLIQQILTYPLADSTPMDNVAFIQRLKHQVTSIF